MKKINFILTIAIFTISQTISLQAISSEKSKPNVILLLVDDLGWKDVGFMGSKFYETPNIDKLANQGIVFTDAYAACAVCSPTRASIQTGRYPARIGVTDWIRARFQVKDGELAVPPQYEENGNRLLRTPSNPYWLDLDETTIAEVLKKSGYYTCHIGKWHLGPDEYYPEKQGYDVNIAGCDMGQPVNYFDPYANEKGVHFPTLQPRTKGEYLEDRLSDELINEISNHKNQPFFINMCYYAVHTPLMGKPEIIDKYETKSKLDEQTNAIYASMIESVDDAVGKLLQTLENENLLDNTLIIFFSDNGGLLSSTSNKPLRSGKGYPYEGGIREPMFVYWKGKIQPGTKCEIPISSIDLFPTICKITNTPLPQKIIDGRDVSPLFWNQTLPEVPLFWHFPHYRGNDVVPYSIIRDGDWKLIKRYEGVEYELFNLKEDLEEKHELSKEFPDKTNELNSRLQEWLKTSNAKLPILK